MRAARGWLESAGIADPVLHPNSNDRRLIYQHKNRCLAESK
jgi:hypothetical protein